MDSSVAGGPQLEPTPLQATREEDGPSVGPRGKSEYTTVAGPTLRGPAPTRRPDGLRRRQRAPQHLPLARAGRTALRGPRCGSGPSVA
jgi:hypothetical protein